MERNEPEKVGDVLRQLLDETSLQHRMLELKAIDLWCKVAGSEIVKNCRKPLVRNGVMTVSTPHASLRQELFLNRSRLKEIINEMIGKEIIKEIKFIS